MKIPLLLDYKRDRSGFRKLGLGFLALLLLYFGLSCIIDQVFYQCLVRYYGLKPAAVLCIGHSMSSMGIDRTLLEEKLGVPVSQYCMNGVGPGERLLMLKQYLETVEKAPEILVYDVNARLFASGLSLNSHLLFLPFMGKAECCDFRLKKYMTPSEYLFMKWNPLCRYDNDRLGAVQRGLSGNWRSRKTEFFDPAEFRRNIQRGNFWHINVQPESLRAFEETLQLCREKKIHVFLACLPSVDLLNQAEPEKYAEVMKIFHACAEKDPGVSFADYNPEFSRCYELFGDPLHLRPSGQRLLSEALAGDLCKLKKLER